ncbi:MAG: hypothetical protein AAF480_12365 [Actinomycetota bacterium]
MTRRWAAATVAFVALAAGCTDSGPNADEGTVVIREEVVDRPVVPSEPSAQILREQRIYADPAPLGTYQEANGVAPLILDPGVHVFDNLGIEFTLELDEFWRLDWAHPGSMLLTAPDAGLDPLLPALTIHRPIGFAPPFDVASDRLGAGPAGWQPDWRLADWIDAIPQVVLLQEGTIPMGDRVAQWFDVEVDPELGPTKDSCQPGSCVTFLWSGKHTHSVARSRERIRWYEIDDPQGPIIGFVSASDEQWPTFVEAADRLFAGATLGPSAPPPFAERTTHATFVELPSNEAWTPAGIPGIRLESGNFFLVLQRPGQVTARLSSAGGGARDVGIATPVTDWDGTPLLTAAEVVDAITADADQVFAVTDGEIFGASATIVDFDHRGDPLMMLTPERIGFDPTLGGWPREYGRVRAWVADTTLGPTVLYAAGEDERRLENALGELDWFTGIVTICDGATDSCEPPR